MNDAGQIRQGDVLLIPVDVEPPSDATTRSELILARGELTGHAHRLTGNIAAWGNFFRIRGDEPGCLSHEEHDPQPAKVIVPHQTYQIVIQREYSLDGMWRSVVD